jgi:hypothetical protein
MSMDETTTTDDDAATRGAASETAERVRAHLEAFGSEIPPFNVIIPSRVFLSAYVRIENLQQGRVCYQDFPNGTFPGGPRECARHWLLDVVGSAQTGADGSARFLLTDFLCEGFEISNIGLPVGIVATPLMNSPVWLTAGTTVIHLPDGNGNVEIRVFSWRPGGNPSPRTWFSWRLLVPGFIRDPNFGPT